MVLGRSTAMLLIPIGHVLRLHTLISTVRFVQICNARKKGRCVFLVGGDRIQLIWLHAAVRINYLNQMRGVAILACDIT